MCEPKFCPKSTRAHTSSADNQQFHLSYACNEGRDRAWLPSPWNIVHRCKDSHASGFTLCSTFINLLTPSPLVTVTNQLILFSSSAFWGPPSPHPLRTSYVYGSPSHSLKIMKCYEEPSGTDSKFHRKALVLPSLLDRICHKSSRERWSSVIILFRRVHTQ